MLLYVSDISGGFPRDGDRRCAFCHGDPIAEHSQPGSDIAQYMARQSATYQKYKAEFERTGHTGAGLIVNAMRSEGITCPLCLGRPT
jgi:hypothetical protein